MKAKLYRGKTYLENSEDNFKLGSQELLKSKSKQKASKMRLKFKLKMLFK